MTETGSPPRPVSAPGKRASWVLAIAVHLVLAVFLIYGVHWQTKAPEAVEVELVRAVPAPAAVPPAPTSEPEPPKPEPKPEPRPEPKPEPKPLPPPPKPDIAIKEPKKPPEKTPPKEAPKEVSRPDPFKEMLKRESAELDQRKRDAAIDKELSNIKAAQAASARSKGLADWLGRIRGKIRGNIVVPPDVKGNPEAVFDVNQLPSGEIISVKLKKSSGHAALDNAIERAILKSSPLPKPEKGELFERSLELKFRPLED